MNAKQDQKQPEINNTKNGIWKEGQNKNMKSKSFCCPNEKIIDIVEIVVYGAGVKKKQNKTKQNKRKLNNDKN